VDAFFYIRISIIIMRSFLYLAILLLTIVGCSQKNKDARFLTNALIDSIIKHSDSSYEKPYYRTDFVTAAYYLSKKDSTVCQLMKDSAGNIRQIIITKKDARIFFAQYYPNGNPQADLPLDSFGQFHGTGKFFYEDGSLQSTGNYNHGFKTGDWKVYDEKGKVTATDSYDNNGNLVPQKAP
jgi:antitoxin component YwqK of YwqJK toxin-antitoxin module